MIKEEQIVAKNVDVKFYSVKDEIKYLILEVLNFIETIIHSILYVKNVYSRELFQNHRVYNINVKYLNDDNICDNINKFLNSIEVFLSCQILKNINILIMNADNGDLIEFFSLNIDLKNIFIDTSKFDYDELLFTFKSILHKFYQTYLNKIDIYSNINKTIQLCVETNENSFLKDIKEYEEIKNIFMSDWVEIVNKDGNYKTEVIGFHETINFTIVLDENKISK